MAKASQKELASLRSGIDNARLQIKRELTKPIKEFDDKMGDLMSLVINCETPIKAGIEVFNAKERAERKDAIDTEIDMAVAEAGLNTKFASKFAFDQRWLNKTATKGEVSEAINRQVATLKSEQDLEAQFIVTVSEHVKAMNECYKLAAPLKEAKYAAMVDSGLQLSQLIARITSDATAQAEAERKAVEKASQSAEAKAEPKAPVVAPVVAKKEEPTRTVVVEITGTEAQLIALSGFLKTSGMAFRKQP